MISPHFKQFGSSRDVGLVYGTEGGSLCPVRIFIIVAKNRPDLYRYFTASFAGVDGIEVILDRRIGADVPFPGVGEFQGERRTAGDIYEELEQRGFVIVRVPT